MKNGAHQKYFRNRFVSETRNMEGRYYMTDNLRSSRLGNEQVSGSDRMGYFMHTKTVEIFSVVL